MNNTPGSGGRKTDVTQGNGNVGRREEAKTGGPAGRKDGYSGRKGEGSNGREGGQRDGGQRSSGVVGLLGALLGSAASGSGSSSSSGARKLDLKKIIIIIVLAAIAIWLFKTCSGGSCSLGNILGSLSGTTGSDFSQYIDSGYDQYSESDMTAATALSASTSSSDVDTHVSNQARDKRTVIKGGGNDEVLLMIYMCGTDLESKYGMATNDLNEMLHASLDDSRVHIIVETGGTKQWKNSVISSSTNQRWLVTDKGLKALDNNVGRKNMTDPTTLTDFIKFCRSEYPSANRNMLILWDHGGGSLSGYGYDQNYSGSMTLDKLNKALKNSGTTFDFIGFDACLMATMETALVTEQYADYLIGSEETEPGCGWYYTNWLTELSNNTSVSTVKLAKTIIDDFNDVCKKNNAGDSTTLSVTDLAEFAGTVPEAFSAFASSISDMLDGSEYQTVAKARSAAREFGASSRIDHVDLIHLASGIGTDEAKELISVLSGCIKYNRTSRSMTNAYGMSIYFPLSSLKGVNSAVSLYNAIGMDKNYSACVKSFASLAAGGQIATGTTSSPVGSLLGSLTGTTSSSSSSDVLTSLLSGYLGGSSGSSGSDTGSLLTGLLGGDYSDWFDGGRVMNNLDYYDAHAIYADDMLLTDKDGAKVLHLTDEKWQMVDSVQLNVFLDDGQGYIDLGMDSVYRFDDDGDLAIEYDRTWMALDGQVVPCYMISHAEDEGGAYSYTFRIPAYLTNEFVNNEFVYVIVVFDNETEANEHGYVAGARKVYDNNETDTEARGLIAIKPGDKLDFVCDYYDYDGNYKASYYFGETVTVGSDIRVSNVSIGSGKCLVTYCLTDMYGNEFWTESMEF